MLYALLALLIVNTLLLCVVACWCVTNGMKLEWLKQVLIPFMASLTRFINPEKK
jgi:hypothetical protein